MEQTKLVAGEKGLENDIKWVTVIEVLEDIDRLQKGEFLITTGFKLMEDKVRLKSFHKLLSLNLLSGVAIYTSFYLKEIPTSFIDLANKYDLPLIEIPVDINFSEITKEILEQIVNRQANLLAHSEKIHHELSQLILNDQSLSEVTKRLSQLTTSRIIIYNEFAEIIYDDHHSEMIHVTGAVLYFGEKQIDISHHLSGGVDDDVKKTIRINEHVITIYPIIAKQSYFGWIVMCKREGNWQELDDIAIGRASTIYAMEFLKKQAIEEAQMRVHSNLLEDIFNKNYTHERIIIDQALKLNYDLSQNQSVFHLTFKYPEQSVIQPIDRLYHITENLLIQKNKQHIIQSKAQAITFLTNVHGKTKEEQKQHTIQLAKEIINEWNFSFSKNELIIGIGKCYKQLSDLGKGAREARYAVTLYPLIDESVNIVNYDDLGMYDFLLKVRQNGISLPSIFEENISGLLNESEREIDLIETMGVYFNQNQSIQKAAEKLYIHRHTLRYRLKQVEQKTGLDFGNPNDLLRLQIGVMAFKLYHLFEQNDKLPDS